MEKMVDVQLALSTMNNLEFILKKVYEEFLLNNKNLLLDLESAISDDNKEARRLVHSIKGISINLGSKKMYQTSKDFEEILLAEKEEEIKNMFPIFRECFQNMYQEIDGYLKEMN
ncbi:Hpt domain-containing protein [Mycoplasmatota bacterium]|nr:Hpt domain-containing protein [Mycoplasmatota bacterium]